MYISLKIVTFTYMRKSRTEIKIKFSGQFRWQVHVLHFSTKMHELDTFMHRNEVAAIKNIRHL